MKKLFYSLFCCFGCQLALGQDPCSADTIPPELETVSVYQTTIFPYDLEATVTPMPILKTLSDNCTNSADLELALRVAGTGTGFPNGQSMLSFNCDYQNRFVNIEIWARDAAGNAASVNELIFINEPPSLPGVGNPCGGWADPSLASVCARTESGSLIEGYGATISFSYPFDTVPRVFSDETIDKCRGFPVWGEGFVTLRKDKLPLNGVSTFDLILINKHILGTEPLNSPYKKIAADANRSGTITMFDILELRKLVLGIYNRLPENTSWRFLPEDHVFPDSVNPFTGMPIDTFYDHFGSAAGIAFNGWYIGMKVGDVNDSANPESVAAASDERTMVKVSLPDKVLQAGDEVVVPIALQGVNALYGLQFALNTDTQKIKILDLKSDMLPGFSDENFHLSGGGKLRLSWQNASLIYLSEVSPVIMLKIKALEDTQLRDVLFLDDRNLQSELVLQDMSTAALRLNYLPKTNISVNWKIFPDPFSDHLNCQFQTDEPGYVHWQLYQMTGQLISDEMHFFEAGSQNWHLAGLNTLPSGIYAYRLKSGKNIFTGILTHLQNGY